jgi:hypothetical protein
MVIWFSRFCLPLRILVFLFSFHCTIKKKKLFL